MSDQNKKINHVSFGPNWLSLREKLGEDQCALFMFMASFQDNGQIVHAYKHRHTRRNLNLDETGQCYAYRDGRYVRITDQDALNYVFNPKP